MSNGEIPAVLTIDFESFYAQTSRRMLPLAFSLTGSWGDAEDLVQDAYIAAHRHWNKVGAYDDPTAWIRRVMINRSLSRWRRLGREVNVWQRLAARTREESRVDEPIDDEFWEAVRALPRQQAAVVALYYLEDLSVDAIAALIGCSAGTVKTQLFRARHTLADRLGSREEEERNV